MQKMVRKSDDFGGGGVDLHFKIYGNSAHAYSVRTITLSLIHYLKVSQVSKYEISITLLLIFKCPERVVPIQIQK